MTEQNIGAETCPLCDTCSMAEGCTGDIKTCTLVGNIEPEVLAILMDKELGPMVDDMNLLVLPLDVLQVVRGVIVG